MKYKDCIIDSLLELLILIWMSLQSFLGAFVVLITRAEKEYINFDDEVYEVYFASRFNKSWSGVSLGPFIIFANSQQASCDSVKHEFGHFLQSAMLGPLYLILIGLPSICGNLWDRFAHRNWLSKKRIKWYYSQPWEHWADILGNVDRGFDD